MMLYNRKAFKFAFPKGKHIYNILAEKMLEPNGEIETAPNRYIITNIYTNKKVGFEYQGIQHYEAVDYFGGEEALKKRRELDELKAERCKFHGVKLLYWKYDEPLTDVVYFQKIKDLK